MIFHVRASGGEIENSLANSVSLDTLSTLEICAIADQIDEAKTLLGIEKFESEK